MEINTAAIRIALGKSEEKWLYRTELEVEIIWTKPLEKLRRRCYSSKRGRCMWNGGICRGISWFETLVRCPFLVKGYFLTGEIFLTYERFPRWWDWDTYCVRTGFRKTGIKYCVTGKKLTVKITSFYLIYSVSRKLNLTVIKPYGDSKNISITD